MFAPAASALRMCRRVLLLKGTAALLGRRRCRPAAATPQRRQRPPRKAANLSRAGTTGSTKNIATPQNGGEHARRQA